MEDSLGKPLARRRSPTKKMSQIMPRKRRQWVEARAGDGCVELWWVPPTHISAQGEPNFENSRLVGAVTGVVEVSYPEDEDLSEDEVRKQMKYEVEVSIADADTRGFFGFTAKDDVLFEIAAESLWDLADGWVLATAYELFFYVTYGEWGHPMLVPERRQQIGATVLRAVRKHNSVFEPSSEKCEIAELWLQAVAVKASLHLKQQELLERLSTCAAASHRRHAEVISEQSEQGEDLSAWLHRAQRGVRFTAQKVELMPAECRELLTVFHDVRGLHVMGQVLQVGAGGTDRVLWIVARIKPVSSALGLPPDTDTAEAEVFYIPDQSATWKRKFLVAELSRSADAYVVWHKVQAGVTPATRLGSLMRVGSPVLMRTDATTDYVGTEDAQEVLARAEAKAWLENCNKPQVAIEKVVKLLLIRAYRAFKHWLCVSLWQNNWDNTRFRCKLMCGEAVWSVVLARKECFNANSSVWLDDGEYQEVDDLNCLVPYSVQQADLLVGTVPDREHYVNLGVTVPSRLDSEWLKITPENFDKMPEDELMSMIDRELLWLDEILAESPLVSKPVSDVITVDWILYLADDFHWRGGEFLCREGDHLAQVQFDCKIKTVAISRCEHVSSSVFEKRVNSMAHAKDFENRGLSLPHGYYYEKTLLRWFRQRAGQRVKFGFKLWAQNMQILRRWRGRLVTRAKKSTFRALEREASAFVTEDLSSEPNNPQQSQRMNVMPAYTKIRDAKHAKCIVEAGVNVIRYVVADYDGNFVCASEGELYLLSQHRIPVCMRKPVGVYKLWHLNMYNCNYDDFSASHGEAAPQVLNEISYCGVPAEHVLVVEVGTDMVRQSLRQALLINQHLGIDAAEIRYSSGSQPLEAKLFDISIFEESMVGKRYGDVWTLLSAHPISLSLSKWGKVHATRGQSHKAAGLHKIVVTELGEDSPFDRELAYYAEERSQHIKLSTTDTEKLEGAAVTLLTETKLPGRKGAYAEYIFTLDDGAKRSLSAREKMSMKVKKLVAEYEHWHLEQVGAYSTDWIHQQDESWHAQEEGFVSSGRTVTETEGDLTEEGDEESDPDDLSDLDTCRQIAERDLQQQGLLDYNVVRHIDTWDDAVLREYARSGEVAVLPRVHGSVHDLAGKPLLVYETVTDMKERLTMTDDEQMNSWFAVGAAVIGESGSSNQKEPAVIVMTETGEGLPPAQAVSFQISDLHATLQDGVG